MSESKKKQKAVEDSVAEDSVTEDSVAGDPVAEDPAERAPTDAEESDEAQKDPTAALREERDKLERQLQRTLADLQNFRRRRVQEMADARKTAIEGLAAEMLPVLDNFHLATEYGSDTGEAAMSSMREGLLMVRRMLEGVFERHGVTEIPAQGEPFDPKRHEAVGIDPDPDAEKGVITRVLQRGYQIDGKVIRPARVMVGGSETAPAETSTTETTTEDPES